jgi:hypothetical protein
MVAEMEPLLADRRDGRSLVVGVVQVLVFNAISS